MRPLPSAFLPGRRSSRGRGRGPRRGGGEGRVRGDAAPTTRPPRSCRASPPEVGWTPGRGILRSKVPEEEGRASLDRHQHRLDHPQSRGVAPGTRHARFGRSHRRRGDWPPSPASWRVAHLREPSRTLRCAASALPRDRLDTDILGANPRGHALGARAHRHRSPRARAGGSARFAAFLHPCPICASCTSRTRSQP